MLDVGSRSDAISLASYVKGDSYFNLAIALHHQNAFSIKKYCEELDIGSRFDALALLSFLVFVGEKAM